MGSRLTKLRDELRRALGRPDPALSDVLAVLEHRSTALLPFRIAHGAKRQHVAKTAVRVIEGGYRPGEGLPGVRRALRRCPELGDVEPDVAPELRALLDDLASEVDPHPFD